MILRPIWLLASLVPIVAAYPKFTTPASGASVPAGTLSVAWTDEGDTPTISQLTSYQLFLVGGGNEDAQTMNQILVQNGLFSGGNTATGDVPPGFAGSTANGYYLKMIAVATQGGTITVYSDRFTLTGMTGTFPSAIASAIAGISGATDVPTMVNAVANTQQNGAGAAAAGTAAQGSYAIAYSLQTGPTKYAPMPSVPPTKISKNKATPLYPTSAFTIATTKLATPLQVWTNTASQTYSASSIENTAAAAAMPTDTAMARFLNRWKD